MCSNGRKACTVLVRRIADYVRVVVYWGLHFNIEPIVYLRNGTSQRILPSLNLSATPRSAVLGPQAQLRR